MKDSTYVLGIHGHDADSLTEEETVLPEEETVLPADSAFLSGTLHLPHGTDEAAQDRTAVQDHNLVQDTIIALMAVIFILYIRNAVSILPMIAGCLLRWKECLNLENSMKLSHDRNIFAIYMTVPFCLAISCYRLYDPEFLSHVQGLAYTGCIFGVFAGYLMARTVPYILVRKPKGGEKTFKFARRVSWSYFCIMAAAVLATAGICSFSKVSMETSRTVLYYVILSLYLLSVFRKFQIFNNSCSFLTSFLYLCALEILPAGILVLPAVFL